MMCKNDESGEVLEEHAQKVRELQVWMESQVELKGRTDGDFLLMFLRSCAFDVKLSKTTLTLYYESRVQMPEWWNDRDLTEPGLKQVLKQKIFTALTDVDPHRPVVTIIKFSRIGSNPEIFDDIVKLASVMNEVIARRQTCQLNGHTCIVDMAGCPWWFVLKALSPTLCTKFARYFMNSLPVRLNKTIYLNSSYLLNVFFRLFKPFLAHRYEIAVLGSDWSTLGDHVPLEVLSEEYGGLNGTMKKHEGDFEKEMTSFNQYLIEDNEYGFRAKTSQ